MARKTIIIAAAVMFISQVVFAADQPAKKGGFSESDLIFETLHAKYSEVASDKIPGAGYTAKFRLDAGKRFRSSSRWSTSHGRKVKHWNYISGFERAIIKTKTGEELTWAQKDYILKGYAFVYLDDGSEHDVIFVNGVDKEQTEKTVVAFLEYLDETAKKEMSHCRRNLSQLESRYQTLAKELEVLKNKLKLAKEKYIKQKADTHYLSQEAAFNAIERMNAIYEENVIKLRVLKAKHKVVTDCLSKENTKKTKDSSPKEGNDPVETKLKGLLVDISVSLAEVEATVETAEEIRKEAENFIRYEDEYNVVIEDYTKLSAKVAKAKGEMVSAGELVISPSKRMLPPKVIDNVITVHPVKYRR